MTRGRPRAVDDVTADRIRWMYDNTTCSMEVIARHFKISAQTVNQIIERKGAYRRLTNP